MTQVRPAHCGRCGARLARDNTSGRCAPCQVAERDRIMQAPEVPADFWDNAALRHALAARHMGQVIRAYRCHPYHGRQPLPQEVVAGWVGLTQAQLSRIEHGPAILHLDRLIHWAQVLGIPETLLWFKLPDTAESAGLLRRTVGIDSHRLLAIPATGAAFAAEDDPMRRRSLFTTLPTATAAGLVGMAGIESLRHRLLTSRAGDGADLDDWEAIAWEYGSTSADTPPRFLLDDLTTDLVVAHERLDRLHDNAQRARLYRVLALLSVFMAHTLAGLGNARVSWRWWRVARDYAAGSSDPEARMWVSGRQIIGGLYERQSPEQLLALADEAVPLTMRTIPGIGTGSVLIGRAQVLAVLGRAAEAQQAIAQVHAVLDRLPERVTTDTDSLFGWPEHRLRHGESFVYSYLGDTKRAGIAQERALALYPPHLVRERTQIRLHQAMCLVRTGDPIVGAAHAREALTDLPADQHTEVVREVARSVMRLMPPSAECQPEVAELRELLALPATSGE
jgi:transcriptional regulator with XRE-family HTH domain